MSLDINWKALDDALARSVKNLLNAKFTTANFPSCLRNPEVSAFSLGTVPPEITLTEVTDPFPEFYEDEDDYDDGDDDKQSEEEETNQETHQEQEERRDSLGTLVNKGSPASGQMNTNTQQSGAHPQSTTLDLDDLEVSSVMSGPPPYEHHHHHHHPNTHVHTHTNSTTSAWEGTNLPYFHSAFAAQNSGIMSASGLSTPRPAWAGGSTGFSFPASETIRDRDRERRDSCSSSLGKRRRRRSIVNVTHAVTSNDTQLGIHIKYRGDIRIELKLELAVNYPSPAFVSLPLRMIVSDVEIDTTAVLAYIEKKVHFSLLDNKLDSPLKGAVIESHIGEADKVPVKDLEKVEKFVLSQIRKILETEVVFPSYYTFMM